MTRCAPFVPLIAALAAGALLAACATPPRGNNEVLGNINDVLLKSAVERKAPPADALDKAMMPPLEAQVAAVETVAEPRFDLAVVNAPAAQVFSALVSGTRYSMLVAPDVTGNLTINLKDVTVLEALDTIRELYGYEYRLQGKRIFIDPNTMKTKVFQINYLASRRLGNSDLRVSGGSITTSGTGVSGTTGTTGSTAVPATGGQMPPAGAGSPSTVRSTDTSRVSMITDSDFWGDLQRALLAIVGQAEGRKVVVNPSSGVLVVRALPGELRNVDKYLKATQLVADRQVMLEAKIIDVSLSQAYQSGINWATFNGSTSRVTAGVVSSNATVRPVGGTALATIGAQRTGSSEELMSATGGIVGGVGGVVATAIGGGFVGLALQTRNFAALLNFLETQGTVSVLSSPRIATLNNQKAVLKVGTDELFVTNVTTTTTTTTTGSVATPSLTLQPYFSGISLDVTPQVDDEGNVILHVHPAVSTVAEKEKIIDLGTLGTYKLPLASSNINETDSIVRVQDGNIVAIGGLMRQEQTGGRSGLPGAGANPLAGQSSSLLSKRELVILIKPTVIQSDRNWQQDIKDTQERVQDLKAGNPFQ